VISVSKNNQNKCELESLPKRRFDLTPSLRYIRAGGGIERWRRRKPH
jgi:hypothetical protein